MNDKYLGYLTVMDEENDCKHWEKETKWELQREHDAKIRADAITEVFKGIYEHFEKHHIEVFGKDEILDELILFLDEYYVYTKIKEQLKEQK